MPLMYRSCCGFACGLTFGVLIWKPGSFGRSPFSRYFSRVPIVSEDIAAATRVYPPARTHERCLRCLHALVRQPVFVTVASSLTFCSPSSSSCFFGYFSCFSFTAQHRTAQHSTAQHRTAPQSSWSMPMCRASVDPRLPPRRTSVEVPAGRSHVSEIQIFLTSFKYFRTKVSLLLGKRGEPKGTFTRKSLEP